MPDEKWFSYTKKVCNWQFQTINIFNIDTHDDDDDDVECISQEGDAGWK